MVLRVVAAGSRWIACTIAGETLWAIDDLRRAWSISLIDGRLDSVMLRR